MIANQLLSFTIPTYNRVEFLEECLDIHIPIAKKYNIPIYISDNNSTDTTFKVIEEKTRDYPLIKYHKNNTNIGPDKNFQKALELPSTEYIWLLGDSYKLPIDGVEYLMNSLKDDNQHFDMIIFNLNKNLNLKSKIYTNPNLLLNDLGALMSCITTLIFSRNLILNANFSKYYDTNYIQTGVIFDYLSSNPCKVKWIPEHYIALSNIQKKFQIAWYKKDGVFEIGLKKWQDFIFSLPDIYNKESKFNSIHDFDVLFKIFTYKTLVDFRKQKILTPKIYHIYKKYIDRGISVPKYITKLIVFFPIPFLLERAIQSQIRNIRIKTKSIRYSIKEFFKTRVNYAK